MLNYCTSDNHSLNIHTLKINSCRICDALLTVYKLTRSLIYKYDLSSVLDEV